MMILQLYSLARSPFAARQISMTQSSGDRNETLPSATTPLSRSPAEEFSPLASAFRRRLVAGVGSASLVAVGANFAGITSSLLGFSPEIGRDLRLDVLYPIGGYSRCLETNEGFEFIYPSSWVGDQTLLYRAAGRAESGRSLDPPPLNDGRSGEGRGFRLKINEPIVAFGPPGSNGELNVSVIVSSIPLSFSFEAFGGPREVLETVLGTVAGSTQWHKVSVTLLDARLRENPLKNVKYYELEFTVESPSFQRRNVAVCCTQNGQLFTLNAQAPESAWPAVKSDFYRMAHSFSLTS